MSKRIVAFAALVVTGQETTAAERTEHRSEENAFLSRARKITSEVFQFDTGWALVSQLVEYSKSGAIDDIRIHDHGFWGGIIGKGYDQGWYDNQYRTSKGDKNILYYQASTSNFAHRVSVNQIKLADSCSIITYGCNCSGFAQELSAYLGQYNRADISATGADNNVYEKSGTAHVDSRTDGLSEGARGQFRTYKNGVQTSAKATWSYK